MTFIKIPETVEKWHYQGNSSLEGWLPKTLSDETDFGLPVMSKLEEAEDAVGELCIDITEIILEATK